MLSNILNFFPEAIRTEVFEEFQKNEDCVQEIRVRVGKPIILKLKSSDILLKHIVNQKECLQILEKLCESSIYAYKNQMCEGFLTIKGGHRIGITGTVVIENEKIINMKYITSLNFRIAREVLNCSDRFLKDVIDIENDTIFNTLIVSPPGKGKTTLLRDLIRKISDGIPEINFTGKICGVVDERSEIAASYKGIAQNDIGIRTDVIVNVPKHIGITMLIRSMGPQIIACDEIGGIRDIEAIKIAMLSGVKGIFTMHGKDMADIQRNKKINELVDNKQIEKIIFL